MFPAETYRAERVLSDWHAITDRAAKVYEGLDEVTKPAYFELVYMLCLMQTNLNELYVSCEFANNHIARCSKTSCLAARSTLYAQQARTAANVFARKTFDHFENDWNLTERFHSMLDGKWNQ